MHNYYYDAILGGIAALMLAGLGAAVLTTQTTIIIFGLLSMVLVGHALFLNPPTDQPTRSATVSHETQEQ